MTDNSLPESAVDRAHRRLIEQIVDGTYPAGTELPGERVLCKELGIARNALREALQRLSHSGWLEVRQGRATRVRDYTRDGSLMVLLDLLDIPQQPLNFVPDLMATWSLIARSYTAEAVRREPGRLVERLDLYETLSDTPEACTRAMWQLHRALIDYCDNVIYGLMLNSFVGFYERLALRDFAHENRRARARNLWRALREAAAARDAETAAAHMERYIQGDADDWRAHVARASQQLDTMNFDGETL